MTSVRMPFERLMEMVSALSDEDAALPMGALAERWGEPVTRIADAIDAVRVANGERTYFAVGGMVIPVATDDRMPPGTIGMVSMGPDGVSAVGAFNIGADPEPEPPRAPIGLSRPSGPSCRCNLLPDRCSLSCRLPGSLRPCALP